MSHFATKRNLSTMMLGTMLAFGAATPAFAQPQNRDDSQHGRQSLQDLREQRQAKWDESRSSNNNRTPTRAAEETRTEPRALPVEPSRSRPLRESPVESRNPPVDNPPRRFEQAERAPRSSDDQRRENWGELARQQQDRQRGDEQQRQTDQRMQDRQRADEQQRQTDQRIWNQQRHDTQRPTSEPRSPQAAVMQQALARDAQRDDRHNEHTGAVREDNRDWRRHPDDMDDRNNRLPHEQQQRRVEEQRQQQAQWQREESRHRDEYQWHYNHLNREHRNAQYRYQQDYWRRWQAEQARWNRSRFDYNNPFFYTPYNYRYSYGGNWYSTNSYGAEMLQQAIRDGYREGWFAGQADRADRWRFDYRNNYGYSDGSLGYNGIYVSQSDYRYYFRQGFERGYRDGYYDRYQYGRRNNDGAMILPTILGMILAFSIH